MSKPLSLSGNGTIDLCIIGLTEVGQRLCGIAAQTYTRSVPPIDTASPTSEDCTTRSFFSVDASQPSSATVRPTHSRKWLVIDEQQNRLQSLVNQLVLDLTLSSGTADCHATDSAKLIGDSIEAPTASLDASDGGDAHCHPSGCVGLLHAPSLDSSGALLRDAISRCKLVVCCLRYVMIERWSVECVSDTLDRTLLVSVLDCKTNLIIQGTSTGCSGDCATLLDCKQLLFLLD
jgi:hypothetical protein